MQVFHRLCLERHSPTDHRVQQHTQRPNINRKAFIPTVSDDFWRKIRRGPALVVDYLPWPYKFGDAEITYLGCGEISVEEYVVELEVTMQYVMHVAHPSAVDYLSEDAFCLGFG